MSTDLELQLTRFAQALDREAPAISYDEVVDRGTVTVDVDLPQRPSPDRASRVDGVPSIDSPPGPDEIDGRDVLIELAPAVAARRPAWRVALKVALGVAAVLALVVTLATIERGGDAVDPADVLPKISLPIEYPVGTELPDLGETPGPLAAVWVAHRESGGAPELVGLVAETGRFGTLPIELPAGAYGYGVDDLRPDDWPTFALSPDGRRIHYLLAPDEGIVVRDLVSGETYSWDYELGARGGGHWVDADHFLGLVYPGSDADGYLWKPGTPPERVDWYSVPHGNSGLSASLGGDCSGVPTIQDVEFREMNGGDWAGAFDVPVLCDVVGVTNSGLVLGHWKDQRDGNGTVVALDVMGADPPLGTATLGPASPDAAVFDDPGLRRVVVTAGAPARVTLATNLIEDALGVGGGGS